MLNIYVIEDHAIERQRLADYIDQYLRDHSIAGQVIYVGDQAEDLLTRLTPTDFLQDLFFLDVDLGNGQMNGIQLAAEIRRRLPAARIVFVTTHEEMALLTFKYSVEALDYIIKDQAETFYQRIAYCIDLVVEDGYSRRESHPDSRLVLEVGDRFVVYNFAEILCLEKVKLSKQVILTSLTGQLQFAGTLNDFALELPNFVRVHRGCLINPIHIQAINKDRHFVTLTGGYRCPIARRKIKDLMEQFERIRES
ncbi:LytR/AlgR family response regulator transcription factor [Ignavigranum ruoffiae]|uniref:LytR/AlgR family response regulator transcription factor n=1 Tax=Ignavigranum ruoffiae TaxID=89093 RepID=UPI0024AE59A5|nr:LytTR family DNA-binding domain-containing protein [Ignavigranum ruoffiae]